MNFILLKCLHTNAVILEGKFIQNFTEREDLVKARLCALKSEHWWQGCYSYSTALKQVRKLKLKKKNI